MSNVNNVESLLEDYVMSENNTEVSVKEENCDLLNDTDATNKMLDSILEAKMAEIFQGTTNTLFDEKPNSPIEEGVCEPQSLFEVKQEMTDIGNHTNHETVTDQLISDLLSPVSEDNSLLKVAKMSKQKPLQESQVINNYINTMQSQETGCEVLIKQENSENLAQVDIKIEPDTEDGSLVSYDYPQFDGRSLDGSDNNSILGNVEVSLQEEVDIKHERDSAFDDNQKQDDIKLEPDVNVPETHLQEPNRNMNTTCTITEDQSGIQQGIPENAEDSFQNNYDETFQLNSITGDVLPLEQEAYKIIKTKKNLSLVEKSFDCPKCTNKYRTVSERNRHLKIHAGIERWNRGIKKRIKSRQVNRKEKLNKEQLEEEKKVIVKKKEGQEYQCTCGKSFQRRTRMETCLRSHSDFAECAAYSCNFCSKNFSTKDDLAKHRSRVHVKKRFPCKFCPTEYNTRKSLFKHLRHHQKVQLMEYKIISNVVEGKEKLKCLLCSKVYTELSELKSHMMGDHKQPFHCNSKQCKESFTTIHDYASHTKSSHPDSKGQAVLDVIEAFSKLAQAWKCEECHLQFIKADELAVHKLKKHTESKVGEIEQTQCVDCRRVFVSAKSLNSHRRIHHESVNETENELEKGLLCVYCRKICKDENALTSHMRFHSAERKYVCKFCDFRFATPEKRKTHAEIHTGDLKYVCFICEYQCSSLRRLNNHKESVKHLDMKQYLLTGIMPEQSTSKNDKIKETLQDNKVDTSPKKRRLSEEKDDSSTSNSAHNKESIACDVCGEKFSSQKKMLKHKQEHPFIEFPNEDTPTRIFFK